VHHYTLVYFQLTDTPEMKVEAEKIVQSINKRILACANNETATLDQQIHSFDDLFERHNEEAAERILARKANGSPGEMVRLGQKLLKQHAEKCASPNEALHIKDLIELK
jgi:hypothetical protein